MSEGSTPDLTRRISNTLLGAADSAARDRLKRGELDHELQATGFDVFGVRFLNTPREGGRATGAADVDERKRLEAHTLELERKARSHRAAAAATTKTADRLKRELRTLNTTVREEERAAKKANMDAAKNRRRFRILRGRRARPSTRR